MTKQNIQYVVKVLSGVNQGATAEFHDGSGLIIGRSRSCDIIFNGANVADRHIAIELDAEKIRLTPLAQPVYVDGRDIGSHEVALRPNQLVSVGEVDFTIADKNQPWPNYDKKSKTLDIVKKLGHEREVTTKPSLLGNPWLWLAVVVMLLANVHYLTSSDGGLLGLLGLKKTVSEKIVSVVDVNKYPSLYIKELRNGVTEIRGYVSTLRERNAVNKQVDEVTREANKNIVSLIFVDEEIEKDAKQIAQAFGETGVNFATLEHGRLKATGLVDNRRRWLDIKENIRTDIRGVISVNDDEVRNLREMYLVLEKEVKKQVFSKRIALELRKGTIIAKGKLTEEERKQWVSIKEVFIEKSFYPFKFREIFRTPEADIKLSIQSVSVGDIPFVVSKDGDKYFQGSHIGSGYYIKSITDDYILLKNNNIEFPVYFGQKKGKH